MLVWLIEILVECYFMIQYRFFLFSVYSVYGCVCLCCWGGYRFDSFEFGNSFDCFDNLGGKCWDNSNRYCGGCWVFFWWSFGDLVWVLKFICFLVRGIWIIVFEMVWRCGC